MQDSRRVLPAPVQVLPTETASVVTVDDAIWIQNGHYLEYEVVSQSLSLGRVASDEVNYAFHHPRAVGLARMDSSTNEYALLGLGLD